MNNAEKDFTRQEAILLRTLKDSEDAINNVARGNALHFTEALEWVNSNMHKIQAAILCKRVRTLMEESTEMFDSAFMKVYDAAKERLITNDYGTRSSTTSIRFMENNKREGDAYFLDRFEMVYLEIK